MKRIILIASGCFLALLSLFIAVDPNKVPSFILILPFVSIFAILFAAVTFLLQKKGLARTKRIKIAIICAGLPVLLVVLQSIGQLTVRDVLTVALLFVLSYFYITRASAS